MQRSQRGSIFPPAATESMYCQWLMISIFAFPLFERGSYMSLIFSKGSSLDIKVEIHSGKKNVDSQRRVPTQSKGSLMDVHGYRVLLCEHTVTFAQPVAL